MRVLVVGAGIGGLTTALLLHRAGVDVEVREQARTVGRAGVGINLLPHAVRVLDDLDLVAELDEIGVRTRELRLLHRRGQEIVRRPCGIPAGFRYPQFSLHRGRLQDVLLRAVQDRLGPDAVRLGSRLTGCEERPAGVTATFADERDGATDPVETDVLVAADGIHSAARAWLVPDEGPPRWNGVTLWRGATEWPAFRHGDSMIVAGGTAAKLVVYPIGAGAGPDSRLTNWALCVRTGRDGDPAPHRQDWSRRAERADIAHHLEHFRLPDVDHAALVAATDDVFEFPMCDRDPLSGWTRGHVTLLGDAAHPMYPMGSNGGGQAILDAATLADHLGGGEEPEQALRAYEAERLPVTAEVVHSNRRGGPEAVIDEVERRAPDGFDRLDDVISPAEIDAVLGGYARTTGGAPEHVNRHRA